MKVQNWVERTVGVKSILKKIIKMPGARHVSKISLLRCLNPK